MTLHLADQGAESPGDGVSKGLAWPLVSMTKTATITKRNTVFFRVVE